MYFLVEIDSHYTGTQFKIIDLSQNREFLEERCKSLNLKAQIRNSCAEYIDDHPQLNYRVQKLEKGLYEK